MVYYKGALDYHTLQNMSLSQIKQHISFANKFEAEIQRAMKV